jgi:hypothetical protein
LNAATSRRTGGTSFGCGTDEYSMPKKRSRCSTPNSFWPFGPICRASRGSPAPLLPTLSAQPSRSTPHRARGHSVAGDRVPDAREPGSKPKHTDPSDASASSGVKRYSAGSAQGVDTPPAASISRSRRRQCGRMRRTLRTGEAAEGEESSACSRAQRGRGETGRMVAQVAGPCTSPVKAGGAAAMPRTGGRS